MATKKPKAKKMPKKPKASATLATWERYDTKCKEITKHNASALKNYHSAIKKKATLIKKHSA